MLRGKYILTIVVLLIVGLLLVSNVYVGSQNESETDAKVGIESTDNESIKATIKRNDAFEALYISELTNLSNNSGKTFVKIGSDKGDYATVEQKDFENSNIINVIGVMDDGTEKVVKSRKIDN